MVDTKKEKRNLSINQFQEYIYYVQEKIYYSWRKGHKMSFLVWNIIPSRGDNECQKNLV